MPHSQEKSSISFTSLPDGLAQLADTLYQKNKPAVVILSLTDIHNPTKDAAGYWLHPEECIQLHKFKHDKRHREWLGGRICAKRGLRTFLRQDGNSSCFPGYHQCRITAEESGRPYFSHLEGLTAPFPELSISHSKGYATSLISLSHCGIDIQYPAESLQKVRERFITGDEEKVLHNSLPGQSPLSRLVLAWAGKEAVKKMFSPAGMPGFHEIVITQIIQKNVSDAIFHFSRTDTPRQTFPVAAGLLDNGYSLALCCHPGNL